MPELFTIGHSNHEMGRLLDLLRQHQIDVVADVRTSPYSARLPHFSREPLQATLKEAGLDYVFLGKELGARRAERDCYVGARADYDLIAQLPAFQQGLDRIQKGAVRHRITLLCAEKDPLDCHRTILVCRQLQKRGFTIRHILEDGSIEEHTAAERRLMNEEAVPTEDLFLRPEDLLDRAYHERAVRIAFQEEADPAS